MSKLTSIGMLLFCCSLFCGTAYAASESASPVAVQQSEKCTGTVLDETGEGVIGASVAVKGTTLGASTDLDGNFSIANVKKGATLVISYVGYDSQEVKWNGTPVTVTLKENATVLQEVVVTALGIKREKKALGYAMQEVKGDELLQARETNLANALTGKVSGVQIIRSSNGPAGSSKIQLRGANSVTGLNQPLIVVDGAPLDNFTGASNNDFWNPSTDMGNGLSDINAEDIESMSVLKGASAAALYGSRAGNGVILITTKKGRQNNGLGITVSASVSVEDVFMKPHRQTLFGQGSNGVHDPQSGSNWGPKIGDTTAVPGGVVTDWEGVQRPYVFHDNVANFFNTGVNTTENVAFSQMYGKTSIYMSLTRLDDFSKIPGAEYKRTNMTTRISSSFGKDDRWTIDGKVQYINTYAKNRPLSGQNANNYFYAMYTMPITMDISLFRQATDPKDGKMYWWAKGNSMNPYWQKDHNVNKDSRNRFLMSYSLKYQFTDWLNAEIKAGSDMYFTETESFQTSGGPNTETGAFGFGENKFFENNYSFLITAQKDRFLAGNKLGGNLTFGGNLMERKSTGVSLSGSDIIVPDKFWISNVEHAKKGINQSLSHRKTNSLYGTLGINWDGWAFLDGTFRNDWSSTLSKKNRSFFYPSLSASWLISEMLQRIDKPLPAWFSYAKVRASFAQVGNDLDPYQLYNVYGIGSDGFYNAITASMNGTLYNEDVRSELISSWEVGAELRFLNNRLGFDFAWYKSNARRQLLNIPMNSLSGYGSYKVNAGDIQNTGIELMVNATPVEGPVTWETQVNFSTNSNKILELAEGVEQYNLGGYDNLRIVAQSGGNYGEIWGTTFLRVEEGQYKGKLLLNSSGLPQGNSKIVKIGDQQATCLLGWQNTIKWNGLSFSFLIDGRFGGHMYSGTNRSLQSSGTAACTVVNGNRDKFVVDGVISDGNGGYTPSTIEVSPQNYWSTIASATGNLGIGEAYIYDATNIRLRNVQLNYAFSRRLLQNTPFQSLKLGVSCNNVLMISSHMNGVDPESVYATSTNATGFENMASPTSRSFLFNVTFGF